MTVVIMKTLPLLLLLAPLSLLAVSFTGQQTSSNEWTYTLTFDPYDNYSICQPTATITIQGLSHVVGAAPPNGTDLPGTAFEQTNTNWPPEILAGGTGVRWTHVGPGTGNFAVPRYVYGFRIVAVATNGAALLSTSGFSLDTACPLPDSAKRDITTYVLGPTDPNTGAVAFVPQSTPLTNSFAITVIGTPGRTYRLQGTTVFPTTNWEDVLSFTLLTPTTNIVDAAVTNHTMRFYRVASP